MAARAALALALVAATGLTGGAGAETATSAVRAAQAAVQAALDEGGRRGRLAAFAEAIAAQEAALAEARAALRGLAVRQAATRAALAGQDGAAFAALAAVQTLRDAPPLALRLHPAGPVAAARAALALTDAGPALAARADATRRALAGHVALAAQGAGATARLRAARAALQALRADLARRGARDETSQNALAREAAAAVAALALETAALRALDAAPPEPMTPAPWPLPVAGVARADGARLALSAPAWSVVRAPMTASVRYVGAAGGEGLTVVLEPQTGVLVALRGLEGVGRAVGDTLSAGAPLGALGGPSRAADEFLIDASAAKGTIPSRTLYIEVTRGGEPDDPAAWFALTAERTGE